MAGRIRDEDIALVRERTSIADVISEYVTLKPAGGGNLKGLCPFHDEKTPVVQRLAGPQGRLLLLRLRRRRRRDQLRDGRTSTSASSSRSSGSPPGPASSCATSRTAGRAACPAAAGAAAAAGRRARRRGRVLRRRSSARAGARPAREFLAQRGFDRAAAERYGCGFAPDALGPAHQAPAAEGLHRTTSWSPPGCPGGPLGQPDRPVPPPAAVADPRPRPAT